MRNLIKSFLPKSGRKHLNEPAVNLHCSEFEVNNWIISEFILKKIIPVVGIHPFPLNELSLMVATVCRLNPTHIFEWGTHIGKSARIFYETADHFKINCQIHSIDLPDEIGHIEHPKANRGKLVRRIKQVILHQGDGLEVSLKICKKIREKITPLFFLDGDHSYSSVKRELTGIIKNVPNAHILIHDTFYQSSESGYNVGPSQATQDVLSSIPTNYKIIATNTGLPGMTLLYQFEKPDQ